MSNAVPHGWSVQLLGKLADVRSSNVDKKSDASELPVRLCNYTDVYYRNRITSDIDFMHATAKQGEIDRFALEKGDVIITKDSETPDDIAVPALVSESLPGVICGYHLTLLRPKPDRSNGEFLAHLFQLQSVQHYFYLLANGTTRFGLTAEAINTAPLITPPLPEQQKIATILSSVDDVIEKTRAQIDKLKDLKTGMMQQLLTQGIGHTEYKDTPIGRIPKAWEIQNINGLVTKVGSGVTPRGGSAAYVNSGIPLIRSQNVYSDGLRLEDVAYITAEQHKKMANSQLKPNDVLLNITGASIGRCHYLPSDFKEGNVNQHVCIIRPKQSVINSAFLAYLLNSELGQRQIMSLQAGGNREGLNFQQIREISFATPTLPEQQKIVNVLQSIDTKIMTASQKLNSVEQTKKALMQDLLTGKVRVVLD